MEIPAISESEILEFIKCESCGFTEECTSNYISRIRDRYCGLWICGLCIEVVKDEILKSSERIISTEEALKRHIKVCKSFQSTNLPSSSSSSSSSSSNHQNHPIFAMGKLLRKSLDSPRGLRSTHPSFVLMKTVT
ncbi:hypothetical protein M9H77_14608 [Catharanthus roseus]|uniref:Uncharacterized protein n=1 Tax=Catharanthus roseus TaxID=4058 RepID=A0ACC0BNS7_CATRO|nr:hypothetical protein M9H77_14608 [Catharanthus roseus]